MLFPLFTLRIEVDGVLQGGGGAVAVAHPLIETAQRHPSGDVRAIELQGRRQASLGGVEIAFHELCHAEAQKTSGAQLGIGFVGQTRSIARCGVFPSLLFAEELPQGVVRTGIVGIHLDDVSQCRDSFFVASFGALFGGANKEIHHLGRESRQDVVMTCLLELRQTQRLTNGAVTQQDALTHRAERTCEPVD